jgi:hypothetical protein
MNKGRLYRPLILEFRLLLRLHATLEDLHCGRELLVIALVILCKSDHATKTYLDTGVMLRYSSGTVTFTPLCVLLCWWRKITPPCSSVGLAVSINKKWKRKEARANR